MVEEKFETKLGTYYLGDAREIIKLISDETIDVIFTDPPFFDDRSSIFGSYESYRQLLPDLYRVLKMNSFLIVYFPSNRLDVILNDTTKLFRYMDRFIVEFRSTTTKGIFGDKKTLELLIFCKGKPKVLSRITSDILDGIEDPAFITLHPKSSYWKPTLPTLLILKRIVGASSDKILLDPFAGYGSIIFVAEKIGMKWIAIDHDKKAYQIAKQIILENMEPREALKEQKYSNIKKSLKD